MAASVLTARDNEFALWNVNVSLMRIKYAVRASH